MKKGLAIAIISILAGAVIILGALYLANSREKARQADSWNGEKHSMEAQIERLNADLTAKTEEADVLKVDLDRSAEQLAEKEELIADLSKQLAEKEKLITDQSDRLAKAELTVDELSEQMSALTDQMNELQSRNVQQSEWIDELKMEIADKETKIMELKEYIRTHCDNYWDPGHTPCEQTVSELREQIELLQIELSERTAHIEALKEENAGLVNRIAELEAKLEDHQ